MAIYWGRRLGYKLTEGEQKACERMYVLAQENLDEVVDATTDELSPTLLLELTCNEMNVGEGDEMYSILEDCAAEIASIYGSDHALA